MSDPRFLLVRLGSMGDVIHALPAAAALRDTFPGARIDWVVDPKWARLLEGNADLSSVIALDRKRSSEVFGVIRTLRAARYDCAIDFQALYKSAFIAGASGAPRRIGFKSSYAREGLAALFYTSRVNPQGAHKVDHNLALAEFAGARKSAPRFPIAVHPQDEEICRRELEKRGVGAGEDFYVLNPAGGWRSKCWPAERYGQLHAALAKHTRWRGVVAYGPGEEGLAAETVNAAGASPPVAVPLALGPLAALLRCARFVVSADTGPLHLAAALGARVIGLFGPTDPARNGPYASGIVIRNPRNCETTYKRERDYAPSMLSITVDQVLAAAQRYLSLAA